MKTNRRGFFGALAAAAGAVLGIKADAPGVTAYAYRDNGNLFYKFDYDQDTGISMRYITNWYADNWTSRVDALYAYQRPEWVKSLDFYSGDQWSLRPCKHGRLNKEQRQFNPARLPA